MKRVFLVIGLGLVLLAVGVLIKTARLTSMQVQESPGIDTAIDGQEVAEHLANSLRFRTISDQDPAQSNADEFVGLHEFLEETFPRVHSTLRKELIGDYSLLYTWKGQEKGLKPILLLAHQDVVGVEVETEKDWTYPPFEGRIAEGYIWGRGAMDFKVAVTGILEAVEMLLGGGFQPRPTIYLAFGHDEEVGGQRGASQIADLLQSRGAEVEYVLDEGLVITDGMCRGFSSLSPWWGSLRKAM